MFNTLENQQVIIISSMLIVNMLKTVGMFYAKRMKDAAQGLPTRGFDPRYITSALLGVYGAYALFGNSGAINTSSVIDTFMQAGYYAFTTNLVIDFAGGSSKSSNSDVPASRAVK